VKLDGPTHSIGIDGGADGAAVLLLLAPGERPRVVAATLWRAGVLSGRPIYRVDGYSTFNGPARGERYRDLWEVGVFSAAIFRGALGPRRALVSYEQPFVGVGPAAGISVALSTGEVYSQIAPLRVPGTKTLSATATAWRKRVAGVSGGPPDTLKERARAALVEIVDGLEGAEAALGRYSHLADAVGIALIPTVSMESTDGKPKRKRGK
jgi:hypothetical protein